MHSNFISRLLIFSAVTGVLLFRFRSVRFKALSALQRGLYAAGFSLLFFLVAINFVANRGAID
jgi:hypothetical protein